jgi:hypothetical protein
MAMKKWNQYKCSTNLLVLVNFQIFVVKSQGYKKWTQYKCSTNLLVLVNFQIFVVKSQGYEKMDSTINVSFLLTLTRGMFETSVLRRFTACKEHCH